ncbi:AtzE family amidohydrolase [Ferrovibrio sp.]|uniref:AtzE family amidohydrolase n=1 Tax=Ferrovibrio sp. TaxID=1917215 RepID=UPI001B40589D|nr:AtzE family amidohydrolase [Ferrovibrio sp.]MBP7065657.1 AtzE family amidohydrolase [Ferrovibrio sp.]
MIDFTSKAAEIATAVTEGRISALEATEISLARISAVNGKLNGFTTVLEDRARATARKLDAARAAGQPLGPMAGVPFAVKNLYDIAGLPTVAGSKINREHAPREADSPLIERLEAAGAVLVGALNMGEYAYDFTGENCHYGNACNPHDPTRMPGGSSSGSGVAAASGMVPLALGSDTNGSIRVPSSFCGLFGLKPTFGRLPRNRSFPFVASLDHLGPMARSSHDLALAYDVMQGPDAADPVCAQRALEPTLPSLEQGIDGLRIAVADDYFARGGEPLAHEAVEAFAKALGATRRVTIPEARRARAAAYTMTAIEGSNLHRQRLQQRADDFDPDTRDRFLAGALLPGDWYVQANRFRRWYRARMQELFRDVDILLAPAAPCIAPKIGQRMMTLDGVEMPVRANIGLFTQPITFAGLPVVATPYAAAAPMPMGVQVIAAPWREDLALRVARYLEKAGVAGSHVAL